jgi:thiamine-monophosphate kinase
MTSSSSSNRPGEFALIAELFAPLATSRNAFGLKDDAATLPQRRGQDIVVTTDAVIAGVHFLASDPPQTIARKALRVNLSDLAAKGARPAGYLLALSLPADTDMTWLRAFAGGLAEDQKLFNLSLLGGDTTSTPGPLSIAITAFGHVPKGGMLQRRGARAGDLIYVSGTIGDAAGGLALLKDNDRSLSHALRDHLVHRFQVPQPRVSLGPLLRGVASAALDVSDGLIADLRHIADVSGVRMEINAGAVPRSTALRTMWGDDDAAVLRAVTSGDDYEIAFTARARDAARVMGAAKRSGVAISLIGRVLKGRGVNLQGADGRPIPVPAGGWTHF